MSQRSARERNVHPLIRVVTEVLMIGAGILASVVAAALIDPARSRFLLGAHAPAANDPGSTALLPAAIGGTLLMLWLHRTVFPQLSIAAPLARWLAGAALGMWWASSGWAAVPLPAGDSRGAAAASAGWGFLSWIVFTTQWWLPALLTVAAVFAARAQLRAAQLAAAARAGRPR